MPEEELFDIHETARKLRVSEQMIYKLIREGKLNAIPLGRHYRISSADIEIYMEAGRAKVRERAAKLLAKQEKSAPEK